MQDSNIPQRWTVIFAASAPGSNVTTPFPTTAQAGGLASLPTGFTTINFTPVGSGGVPPWGKDMNGILQLLSEWSQWYEAGGPITYDATLQTDIGGYPNGAVVQSAVTAGLYWRSTADNNTSNPDTGGANWTTWPFVIPIPIADGGTDSIGPFTLGGVFFFDGTRFVQDPTNFFYSNATVRLGLGTNAPAATLDVRGTGIFSTATIETTAGGLSAFYAPNGGAILGGPLQTTSTSPSALDAAGGLALGGNAVITGSLSVGNVANFQGLVTASMGLLSLQNLNINTTQVNGGLGIVATNPVVEWQNGPGGNTWVVAHSAAADLTFAFNTVGQASLDQFGNLDIQGTLTQGSDVALKRDVLDLEPVLDRLLRLRPKRYVRRASGRREVGLLAQDVRELFPELVSGEEGSLAVAYANGLAVAIRAIQELAEYNRRPWWRRLLGMR